LKKDVDDKATDQVNPPSFQIFRSDTKDLAPLQIPDTPSIYESGSLSAQPASSGKNKRFTLSGMRHRSTSQNSLPDWNPPDESDPNAERDWEERATKLAKLRPSSMSASQEDLADLAKLSVTEEKQRAAQSADGHLLPQVEGSSTLGMIRGMTSEQALHEAIRLHEEGSNSTCLVFSFSGLPEATALFREIADQKVNDDNRVMGQLLYGLALRYDPILAFLIPRHGWGCKADMNKAVVYLKAAAEIAANVEDNALKSGLANGGKFKNELTLALFELGNCFKNGWVQSRNGES